MGEFVKVQELVATGRERMAEIDAKQIALFKPIERSMRSTTIVLIEAGLLRKDCLRAQK